MQVRNLIWQLSLCLPVKNVQNTLFRFNMLSLLTKYMSYLYKCMLFKTNMCLWDRTYFKLSCYISGKVFKRKVLSWLNSFLSLLLNRSDIKRLNYIVKVVLVYIPWCGSTYQWNLPKRMTHEYIWVRSKVDGGPSLH